MQSNIKIMVNWETREVAHTFSAPGTHAYKKFTEQGFEQVGSVKAKTELPPGLKVFWDPAHYRQISDSKQVVH